MNSYLLLKTPLATQVELASKLRVLRKQAGYSQAELALRSGVSLGSIKRFERTGKISLESLVQLAHLLDRLDDFDSVFVSRQVDKRVEKLFS
ncbi:MAG: helix-turn-helix domain-containing protein [Aquirufa antheringensis]|nr:helix-turn-helix domain-containing protein [Aquirufa antheringensis]